MSNEFASLDEMAATPPEPDGSTLAMAETIRDILSEESSIGVSNPLLALTTPVALLPGRALLLVLTDYEGVEYEVFVQARR